MSVFVLLFFIALSVALLLASKFVLKLGLAKDEPFGCQKTHVHSVLRLGGVSLFVGLVVAACVGYLDNEVRGFLKATLIACSPVFLVGLMEDHLKSIAPYLRMVASAISSFIIVLILDLTIQSVGIEWFDSWLVMYPLVSITFTVFAISGVIHAFNIIDGLNGLSSGVATVCLASFAIIAQSCGDSTLMACCLVLVSITLGFWIVNWPLGKLFLGDSGAYLLGFSVAVLAILLPIRNVGVSPWASLLVIIYPVAETIISMLRRLLSFRSLAGADSGHLHSVVFSIMRGQKTLEGRPLNVTNSLAGIICCFMAAVPATISILWFDDGPVLSSISLLALFIFGFMLGMLRKFLDEKRIRG